MLFTNLLTNIRIQEKIIGQGESTVTNEEAWNFAIGIVQTEGVKPSDYFLELVEKEKRGEITGDDIRHILYEKYKVEDETI